MLFEEIALSLHKGISSKTMVHLLGVFGSAGKILSASYSELTEQAGLRSAAAKELVSGSYFRAAEEEMKFCENNGITPVSLSSEFYPPLLKECCDHPLVLYVMGDPGALCADMLAVVGTRKISSYGTSACNKLIGGLAEGGVPPLTIVSGLAYGVDAAAHRAALSAGLHTVAVMGTRLPRIYPSENADLARKIIDAGGCLVSELHSQSFEGKMNFVARNRIIAGMSLGTLIVESPLKGGSMITAELASGYDRTVMAVPGRMTDINSTGPNFLIRRFRAAPVMSSTDIVEEMNLDMRRVVDNSVAIPETGSEECPNSGEVSAVLELVSGSDGATVDLISDRTGAAAQDVVALLFELELAGKVRKTPGGTYIKT